VIQLQADSSTGWLVFHISRSRLVGLSSFSSRTSSWLCRSECRDMPRRVRAFKLFLSRGRLGQSSRHPSVVGASPSTGGSSRKIWKIRSPKTWFPDIWKSHRHLQFSGWDWVLLKWRKWIGRVIFTQKKKKKNFIFFFFNWKPNESRRRRWPE
jgi:hypothetical protein